MAGTRPSTRGWGWAVGGVATLLGVGVYVAGGLDRLDGYNLDLHFRHFNTLEADPRIVLIDIDDTTLRVMPDWPWPRRVFADLVKTLNGFRPQSIVLDLVFDLPSKPRVEHAGLDRNYDIDTTLTEVGDRTFDETIYDDEELSQAIRDAGNVYLAMFGRVHFTDTEAETDEDLRLYGSNIRSKVPGMSSFDTLVRWAARRFFDEHRSGTWPEFFHSYFRDRDIEAQTPDREQLLTAYQREQGLRAVAAKLATTPPQLRNSLFKGYDFSPPLETLARAAAGVGLVSFNRLDSTHVVRTLPLLVQAREKLFPQLGFVVAMNALRKSDWTPSDGGLETLVNWHREGGSRATAFDHIPATRLLEIVQNRRAIEENGKRLAIARAELVRLRHADTPAAYEDYVKLVNERLPQRVRTPSGSEGPNPATPKPKDPSLPLGVPREEQKGPSLPHQVPMEEQKGPSLPLRVLMDDGEAIARIEAESVVWLQRAWSLWKDETPRSDEESAERERVKRLYDRFGEGQYAALLDSANGKLRARNEEIIHDLEPLLHDKICLVGYTATAMADLVPTPVDPAMPGVMVHANVINMFLQNRFASAASPGVNVLLMLVAGILTTVTASRGGTRVSVAAVIVLSLSTLGAGALVFRAWTYHVAAFATVASLLVVWASVTVYRQATDERSRRKLQRALAQYASPAVAARIVEHVRETGLSPRTARVSCFFSDLSGFTALSERLGAERTRDALNPYLREVSAVIVAHQGMVNKFIGDGVFAFFNAPILPCAEHAAAACESALRCVEALGTLDNEAGAGLAVRIGLSTGDAFVGDYGSDMKLDYTCIGDTVNVAERLERANKVFQTRILVDEQTRQDAGDAFAFRSLGLLIVPGRIAPVAAFELLGQSNQLDEAVRIRIARFEEAIRSFQTCQWGPCLTLLAECRRLDPTDAAIRPYERATLAHRDNPPSEGWNGGIDLTLS